MIYKFFDKKNRKVMVLNLCQIASNLQKPIIRKFKRILRTIFGVLI